MSTKTQQREILSLLNGNQAAAQIIFDAVARIAETMQMEIATHRTDKEIKDGLKTIGKALRQLHLRALGDKVKRARGERALETLKKKVNSDGQGHCGREWLHLREEAALRGGQILYAILELEQAIENDMLPTKPDATMIQIVAELAGQAHDQVQSSRGGPGSLREPEKGPRSAILFHVARAAEKAGITVSRDVRFWNLASAAYAMAGIKVDPENDIRQMTFR